MHPVARAASVVGAVGALGLGYASLVERNAYALRRVTVPVLPARHRPLRVVHVSDLHLMPGQRRKAAWVAALAELRPDLVVNTGDNISHPDAIPVALEAFSAFEGVPGVFVMGSNDYFVPQPKNPFLYLLPPRAPGPSRSPRLPTEDLVKGMLDLGWTDLTNTRATLAVAGSPVEFVGVDDPHLKYDRYGLVEGPFSPEAELRVGVTHAPYQRILDAMTRDGAELVIAGHTHGGQLCLPGYGALVTNCDLDRSRAKGLSRWWPGAGRSLGSPPPPEAAWLEVSAGLGTSPYAPVRFACRPEATLLTLVPAS
ncbi:MAG: metallophosphoesterase [Actinomycetales bacterium]